MRPGDSPSTAFSSGLGRSQQPLTGTYPSQSEDPSSRGQRSSVRPIRPGTGTQSPGGSETGHGQRFPQWPWQSSPTSTAATVSPTYSFTSVAPRPFSAAPSVTDSPYYPSSYAAPSTNFVPMEVPRSYPQPSPYFPQTMPAQFQQFSVAPLSYGPGYQPTTRSPTRPQVGEPVSPEIPRYKPEFTGPHLPPLQPGAAEQAQRQAQRMRPEQFHETRHTRHRGAHHPPDQPSIPAARPKEEEEEDRGEPTSKRRRPMEIGELLGHGWE